jgi:hypothetical protein
MTETPVYFRISELRLQFFKRHNIDARSVFIGRGLFMELMASEQAKTGIVIKEKERGKTEIYGFGAHFYIINNDVEFLEVGK